MCVCVCMCARYLLKLHDGAEMTALIVGLVTLLLGLFMQSDTVMRDWKPSSRKQLAGGIVAINAVFVLRILITAGWAM